MGGRFADHHLTKDGPPWLGVCSSNRAAPRAAPTRPMPKRRGHSARAPKSWARPLSHGEINSELGKPGAYTDAVEAFMASLDPSVAALLKP